MISATAEFQFGISTDVPATSNICANPFTVRTFLERKKCAMMEMLIVEWKMWEAINYQWFGTFGLGAYEPFTDTTYSIRREINFIRFHWTEKYAIVVCCNRFGLDERAQVFRVSDGSATNFAIFRNCISCTHLFFRHIFFLFCEYLEDNNTQQKLLENVKNLKQFKLKMLICEHNCDNDPLWWRMIFKWHHFNF